MEMVLILELALALSAFPRPRHDSALDARSMILSSITPLVVRRPGSEGEITYIALELWPIVEK